MKNQIYLKFFTPVSNSKDCAKSSYAMSKPDENARPTRVYEPEKNLT